MACPNQILLELSAFQEIKQLIGAAFTLMCLLTGSLWGRPMWGTLGVGRTAHWQDAKPTRERVRPRRLALITSQRQVSQQLTDSVISIGAFPLSFVCSQPRPSR